MRTGEGRLADTSGPLRTLSNGRLAGIAHNHHSQPESPCVLKGSGAKHRYSEASFYVCMVVAGGEAAAGVVIGEDARFQDMDSAPVPAASSWGSLDIYTL